MPCQLLVINAHQELNATRCNNWGVGGECVDWNSYYLNIIIIWLLHNEMYMWTVALQMGWFWILISTCFLGTPTFWNLFEVWGQHIHVWKTFGIKSVVFIVVWLLLQRTPLSWKCFEWYHVQACSWWTAKRWSRMPRHLFIKRWQWYAMIIVGVSAFLRIKHSEVNVSSFLWFVCVPFRMHGGDRQVKHSGTGCMQNQSIYVIRV